MTSASKGAALVTGAGQRIGKALAIALAEEGFDVAVHYRSSDAGARETADAVAARGRKTALVKADLSNDAETAAVVPDAAQKIGALTLLVNSASRFEPDEIATITPESWQAHMSANLFAPVRLAQAFAAQWAERANTNASAQIVNIIDQRVLKLTPQFFSYTLSKAALWTATQTMAQALGPKGVRVNAIAPGPVLKNPRQSDEDWARQNAATVLGYGAKPGDIAAALIYLLKARATTGQLLTVDGGQHLAWRTPDVMVGE